VSVDPLASADPLPSADSLGGVLKAIVAITGLQYIEALPKNAVTKLEAEHGQKHSNFTGSQA